MSFKPTQKLEVENMTGVKDKVEEADRAGVVYAINCNYWDVSYIGKTGRKVTRHVTEHKAHAEQGRTKLSNVAEHAWGGHSLDWTPQGIGCEEVTKERKIHAALVIHTQNKAGGTFNRDNSTELSKLWLELF